MSSKGFSWFAILHLSKINRFCLFDGV